MGNLQARFHWAACENDLNDEEIEPNILTRKFYLGLTDVS